MGGGIEYNIAGTTSLLVSVNYHNGFTNTLKKESNHLLGTDLDKVEQNSTLNFVSLSVGILF